MWQIIICGSGGRLLKNFFTPRRATECAVRTLTIFPRKCTYTYTHSVHFRRWINCTPTLIHSWTGKPLCLNINPKRWLSTSGTPGSGGDDSDTERQEPAPLDVDKEILRYDYEEFELRNEEEPVVVEEQQPIIFDRGQTGVFDLEELITVLNEENARDVCAISVPREMRYVDYLVIATGRSTRHIKAMAEYIRWAYKRKRGESDAESVKIEGELSKDWLALDLGNIAVHLFLKDTRRKYDLEQLWTVGSEFDDKSREISTDAAPGAFSLEDFSFDAELEKFRQLRTEQNRGRGSGAVANDAKAELESEDVQRGVSGSNQ